jgi:hypothetical protein
MRHNSKEQHAEEVGKQMPEEPIRVAHFDHVTDEGDLVFVFDHRHFAVRIDDTLERGLMEAKQIRAEAQGIVQPQASSALPISSIQSYIRAGMDTARVAQQFSVNEAIVRRFSAPVETEKKYAIEQFLSVSAPKKSKARNNGELIEASLRNARISPASIAWNATRRNHEPWHIHAKFEAAGRMVKADWTWDMHDNSVSALNSTAKRLLGESDTRHDILPTSMRQALNGRGPTPYEWMDDEISGDEANESEIPPVVQEHRPAIATPLAPHAASEQTPSTPVPTPNGNARNSAKDSSKTSSNKQVSAHNAGVAAADTSNSASQHNSKANNSGEFTGWLYGKSRQQDASDSQPSVAAITPSVSTEQFKEVSEDGDTARRDSKGSAKSNEQNVTNRKSGRSAVPSWDEILFGD